MMIRNKDPQKGYTSIRYQTMGGILKNALSNEEQVLKEKTANESISEFRQKVYENTQLNAKLTGKNLSNTTTTNVTGAGGFIPKDTLLMKREEKARRLSGEGLTPEEEEERLQWNQENLAQNEITKQQFQDIHVDEPKTPYQGAVDPHGEYYNVDDEDNINDFSLGEPEIQIPEDSNDQDESRIETDTVRIAENPEEEEQEEADDDEEEEDAEARHKRFEEMRKKHYDVRNIFHKK